jgi:hypothetical protein
MEVSAGIKNGKLARNQFQKYEQLEQKKTDISVQAPGLHVNNEPD